MLKWCTLGYLGLVTRKGAQITLIRPSYARNDSSEPATLFNLHVSQNSSKVMVTRHFLVSRLVYKLKKQCKIAIFESKVRERGGLQFTFCVKFPINLSKLHYICISNNSLPLYMDEGPIFLSLARPLALQTKRAFITAFL